MKKKSYNDFRIDRDELDEREEQGNLDNLFIVFEEEKGQLHDMSHGIYEGLENAKACADHDICYDDYNLFVANYKDWLDGNYDHEYEVYKGE